MSCQITSDDASDLLTAPLMPQEGPQWEFLASEADIAIYGGAAGGGKTWALLIDPLRWCDDVLFRAIIFRRSYPEIMNAGGLWDQAAAIYPLMDGAPSRAAVEYRFGSGAKIGFRHLQHADSVHEYQGSEICYLAFDELTHFTESQFWYLLSRNRSTCGVRPYVRATCNPDPGWVKSLLAPWVDDRFPERRADSGELRWFIRDAGQIRWVDRDTPDAKSLTFIRASVYDNQALLRSNPEYIANLKALPPVERARLLDGDWSVRREGLVYAGFDGCIMDGMAPDRSGPTVGGIDFGFHNPFAAIYGHLDHDDVLWITGMRYKSGCTIPTHQEALPKNVRWWCDPSGAEPIRQLRDFGHEVRPCVHMPTRLSSGETRKPLLAGIDMVSERIRTGRLKIIREACLPLVRELGMYHYDEEKQSEEPVKEDDHACDALRYLVVGLDRGRQRIPEPSPELVESEIQEAKEAERRKRELDDLRAQDDPNDERWWQ